MRINGWENGVYIGEKGTYTGCPKGPIVYDFETAIKEMRKGKIMQCQYGIYKIENNKFYYTTPKIIERGNVHWDESAIAVTTLLEETFTEYIGGII